MHSGACTQQNVTKLQPYICLAFKMHTHQTFIHPPHRTQPESSWEPATKMKAQEFVGFYKRQLEL